jgi:hypothetical protein
VAHCELDTNQRQANRPTHLVIPSPRLSSPCVCARSLSCRGRSSPTAASFCASSGQACRATSERSVGTWHHTSSRDTAAWNPDTAFLASSAPVRFPGRRVVALSGEFAGRAFAGGRGWKRPERATRREGADANEHLAEPSDGLHETKGRASETPGCTGGCHGWVRRRRHEISVPLAAADSAAD